MTAPKFKVGDRVITTTNPPEVEGYLHCNGVIKEVVENWSDANICDGPYLVAFNVGKKWSTSWWCREDGLELVESAPQPSAEPVNKFEAVAARIGKLTAEKNRQYGSSAQNASQILRVLYKDGVKPEQYDDLLLVVRILDKLSRISHGNKRAGGESAWIDMCGYSLIGAAMDEVDE